MKEFQESDPRLVRYVWDRASRPTCWSCGKFILNLENRDVYGLQIMCPDCKRKVFDAHV